MSDSDVPIAAPPTRGMSPRAAFWLSLVCLLLLGGAWAVGNPLLAEPDAGAHHVRAVSLVRERDPGPETRPGVRRPEVPALFAQTHLYPLCFHYEPTVPASCAEFETVDLTEGTRSKTSAGDYNPLYYVIVGLPTLLPPGPAVLYLMRFASVALCSVMIALGVRSLAEAPYRRWAVAGTGVALVPIVLNMNSTVNPNAVEAAAGLGLWLTLLVALRHPDPALVRRRWWRAGVLVVFLVNAKPFSPLFLAIIVLAVVASVPWASVAAALRDRNAWPGLALGSAGSVAAVAWILSASSFAGTAAERYPDLDTATAGDRLLRLVDGYYTTMIGRFGWLDTPSPTSVYYAVSALLALLLLLALATGRARERAVLVVLCVLVVGLPVALQLPFVSRVGLPWQGRYLEAVAVGVPILAGMVCDRGLRDFPARSGRTVVAIVLGTMAVVHLLSFGANLRRNVAGTEAPWFAPVPDPWVPPLPSALLLVWLGAAAAGTAWFLFRLSEARAEAEAALEDVAGSDDAPEPELPRDALLLPSAGAGRESAVEPARE